MNPETLVHVHGHITGGQPALHREGALPRHERRGAPRASGLPVPDAAARRARRAAPGGGIRAGRTRAAWGIALVLLLAAAEACADTVRISEVVTDPQQDHSESAGGNGVAFDAVPGTGTVSTVDEFIELFNAGTVAVDLSGFRLSMEDGSDAVFTFDDPGSAIVRFSTGSALDGLLPGGFALIGNPAGSLNNSIEVRLLDAAGTLVDLLSVADGNAASVADESVHRVWTGETLLDRIARGPITPLALPEAVEPVPEPGSLALIAFSLFAGALANARRGRHGRPRGAAPGSARR